MPENASHNATARRGALYPPIEPYDRRMLDVSGGHKVYMEQSGNPDGEPVVVLHGGPGGGASPGMRRFFDPHFYRVILFDQRGCGRSVPHASVENNTTWDLVEDIEHIRTTLDIDRWIVFGGSWGATLALIYAQTHPDAVRRLVLRGVFMMTETELDWFYGGGAGRFWPDEWAAFRDAIPADEHDDLISAYHRRLFSDNVATQTQYARVWTTWESALASLEPKGRGTPSSAYARAFARLENHYFTHRGFLERDGQIMANMDRIAHLPGFIVQGRYDMICPPQTAHGLHKAWRKSVLKIVPTDGHALSEPGIATALAQHMDDVRDATGTARRV